MLRTSNFQLADKVLANSAVLRIQQEVMAEIVNYLAPLGCSNFLMYGTYSAISYEAQ